MAVWKGKSLILIALILSESSLAAAEPKTKSKLAPELAELSWLIGSWGDATEEESRLYSVVGLRIRMSKDGKQLHVEYSVRFNGCPGTSVMIKEKISAVKEKKSGIVLKSEYTISEGGNSLGEKWQKTNFGKGSYTLKQKTKGTWIAEGTFTSLAGGKREVRLTIERDQGLKVIRGKAIYKFVLRP